VPGITGLKAIPRIKQSQIKTYHIYVVAHLDALGKTWPSLVPTKIESQAIEKPHSSNDSCGKSVLLLSYLSLAQ